MSLKLPEEERRRVESLLHILKVMRMYRETPVELEFGTFCKIKELERQGYDVRDLLGRYEEHAMLLAYRNFDAQYLGFSGDVEETPHRDLARAIRKMAVKTKDIGGIVKAATSRGY